MQSSCGLLRRAKSLLLAAYLWRAYGDACCLQRSQLQSDSKGTCLWQLISASTEKSIRRLSQVIWDTFLTPKQRDRIYLHDRLLAQVYFSSSSACPSCKINQIDFRSRKGPIQSSHFGVIQKLGSSSENQ